MNKTFTAFGVVLKRSDFSEYDRLVTILTREKGKYVCIAKGARKLNSTKRAALEPGTYVKAFFVQTKSLPLLTQAVVIEHASLWGAALDYYRNVSQVLEILEKLFVEQELEEDIFEQVLLLRRDITAPHIHAPTIRKRLGNLIASLGFQHPDESEHDTIQSYVESLLSQPLKSFNYMSTSPK